MRQRPDPILPALLEVLGERRTLTLVLTDLQGCSGLTDRHQAVIFLDHSNSFGEQRATLLHELLHLARPDMTDPQIEALTAEMLVPLQDVIHAQTPDEESAAAERLGVDAQLVRARLAAAETEPTVALGTLAG